MNILSAALGLADAGILAVLGYAVVFAGLVLLMLVVTVIGKLFAAANSKKQTPAPEEAAVPEVVVETPVAPGTAGQLKLHNVDPKTAAMLMAIVAHKTGKPLNELRFTSIKEVK